MSAEEKPDPVGAFFEKDYERAEEIVNNDLSGEED